MIRVDLPKPSVADVERLIARLESVGHDTTKVATYLRDWIGTREPGEDDDDDEAEQEAEDGEELIPVGEAIRLVTERRGERRARADEQRGQLQALKRRRG